jgi:U3 small nucleolar ribonucleoprotein protein LCP5
METTALSALLASLKESLVSATSSAPESKALLPPKNGISLFDTKNELLLSYLHNLAFLLLLRTQGKRLSKLDGGDDEDQDGLGSAVVEKLVELRLYLERGVRPIESRLKYQIDKVLRAAESANRRKGAATDSVMEDAEENAGEPEAPISDLSYRPNPSSLARSKDDMNGLERKQKKADPSTSSSAPYRPPRITPTAMPIDDRQKRKSRPESSVTLNDYLSQELSVAPSAEPSIGTTIMSSGRQNMTAFERRQKQEQQRYEEENFIRLPNKANKADKRNKKPKDVYGGEEFFDLGRGAERISRLTTKGKKDSLVDKARKRTASGGDSYGGRDDEAGERWEKRRKVLKARK